MSRLLSLGFWMQVVVTTIFTMIMIYFIKKVSIGYNVPLMKQVSEGV